jgi:hypothetical protein
MERRDGINRPSAYKKRRRICFTNIKNIYINVPEHILL